MTSHVIKSCLSPFDLDLTSGMVPSMTLLASCDTDACIMALHVQKLYYTLFQSPCLNDYNGAVDNDIGITLCLRQYQQCQMSEKAMLHLI